MALTLYVQAAKRRPPHRSGSRELIAALKGKAMSPASENPHQLRTQPQPETHAILLAIHKASLDSITSAPPTSKKAYGTIDAPRPGAANLSCNTTPISAWLRKLSGLITQIDELMSSKKPLNPAEAHALLAQSHAASHPR